MEQIVVSKNPDDTHRLASDLAKTLKGGEIIELIGDIGAGKTTFVIGLAKALGSEDNVSSPTFTICNIYHGRLKIQHCDFYRLSNDKLITREIEDLKDNNTVIVLEWSENLQHDIGKSIKIYFEHLGDDSRKIKVTSSTNDEELLK